MVTDRTAEAQPGVQTTGQQKSRLDSSQHIPVQGALSSKGIGLREAKPAPYSPHPVSSVPDDKGEPGSSATPLAKVRESMGTTPAPSDAEGAWNRVIERMKERPGYRVTSRLLAEFQPEQATDTDFIIRKQQGRGKIAAQILQTETRALIESELEEIYGRSISLVVREAAVVLPVAGGISKSNASPAAQKTAESGARTLKEPIASTSADVGPPLTNAEGRDDRFDEGDPIDYEEGLRMAMERAKPRREKLKDLMHDDPEIERAVRLVSETFNGRVVGLDGEPL